MREQLATTKNRYSVLTTIASIAMRRSTRVVVSSMVELRTALVVEVVHSMEHTLLAEYASGWVAKPLALF